jgi:hypothetical protein
MEMKRTLILFVERGAVILSEYDQQDRAERAGRNPKGDP